MAERVVDELEAVEVDEQHADQPAVALGLLQRLREAVEEQAAVGQAGQRVELRQIAQALLGALAVDRGGQRIGQTFQEVAAFLGKAARLGRACAEHAVGPADAVDRHAGAAADAVCNQQLRRRRRAGGMPVSHRQRVRDGQHVAGTRRGSAQLGHRAAAVVAPAGPRAMQQRAAVTGELQHQAEPDLEALRGHVGRLRQQLVEFDVGQRLLPEGRDQALLHRVPAYRLLGRQPGADVARDASTGRRLPSLRRIEVCSWLLAAGPRAINAS